MRLLVLSLMMFHIGDGFGQSISNNVTLWGRLAPSPYRYSGSWAYVDPNGVEYGLVGGYGGTHVIALDDSTRMRQVGFVAGPFSNWREITVIGRHAFVVTEGGNVGMQVIDLSPLPDSVRLVTSYTAAFSTGHIIMRDVDVDSPYVYVSGASGTGGVHILDVSNPAQPAQVGVYRPGYYVHDVHVRGNRMYASALGRGLEIVDISNKRVPERLERIQYANAFTHSAWTTADHNYLFVTDEVDGLPARMWNIENLSNIRQVSAYTANPQSLVHNVYVRGRYAFVAHNTEGLRVVDIADPTLPVEVGNYDTYAGPSGGFNGLWSACPYLPSGRVIGGDRAGGLYAWRFNGARAARMYGVVRDANSGMPIDSALITIVETGRNARSAADGSFKLGEVAAAFYSVRITAQGYHTRMLSGVSFNADSIQLTTTLSVISSEAEENAAPVSAFKLEQNFPNPFNPTTRINFHIPGSESRTGGMPVVVSLKVFDVLGREVTTLVNARFSPGTYAVDFDAGSLPSGVYLYRLTAGGYAGSRKMILAR